MLRLPTIQKDFSLVILWLFLKAWQAYCQVVIFIAGGNSQTLGDRARWYKRIVRDETRLGTHYSIFCFSLL